jgi:Flp pilus assembly protein TadD/SAM-dependent methyltransferase
MNRSVSQTLEDGFEHHRHGRHSEAEAAYRRVLEREPHHPDALHRLGVIAQRSGCNEVALQLINRAIAVNPSCPSYYSDAAVVLHALGRIDEAIARYRESLARDARNARVHNALGIALKDKGLFDDAAESFRLALSLEPDYTGAQNNLANVLRELGDYAEAERFYRQALELCGNSAELWYNLGNVLTDQHAFGAAVSAYGRALSLRPDFAHARGRRADAVFALGQPDQAVADYARALVVTESPDIIAGFVRALAAAALHEANDDVRRIATRALATPWARPAELAGACVRLLVNDAGAGACIERAMRAWPSRLTIPELFAAIDPDVVFRDELFRTLLESAPVCDVRMERFLTLLRYALLDRTTGDGGIAGANMLAFGCALARQCFINDYVFSHTEPELERAAALRDRLIASLWRGDTPPAMDVAVVAAYFPLLALPLAESLTTGTWPQPLAALLTQQLHEPLDERSRRDRIRRLTTIDDPVSISVREQYEGHPYPRWIKLPSSGAIAPGSASGARFPLELRQVNDQTGGLDILVAGCGTGQESIEFAQAFPRSRVLAVDLSMASLAYAERKARDMRVANIEHAQADVMKLASLGRKFDVISSVGVLHHLADPMRGWRELVELLMPAGHMLVGLYSERGRADVVAAKAFIAERGYEPTEAGIRRCRQDLMSVKDNAAFSRLVLRTDFYVSAECRDLLFHVQEHRFTVPRIRQHLDALGLRFNGFVLSADVARRYADRYPDDPGMENLDNWDVIEAEFPHAFSGMYLFWTQKRR